ncbi:MAG: RNA polymerase sigma factor [Archangium sp.]
MNFAALFKDLSPRILGALVRRYRDLQACEDALQEALLQAAQSWPRTGVPDDPRAWLIAVANRRMVDVVRSETSRRLREEVVVSLVPVDEQLALAADEALSQERDDSLELLFMCCQPSLTPASAIALTLRAVGGLTTAEIARAFLVPEMTMAQRLSRARQTVKDAGFQEVDRRARLPSVMHVLYLIFNEGYVASAGDDVHRVDLAEEAIRLTRMLRRSMPAAPEVMGLLALMLLTDARRDARTGPSGEVIPLDQQDRTKWNRALIEECSALVESAFNQGEVGPYQLQAAIAALHDEANSTETTDWPQIVELYSALLKMTPSSMVALNRAIAVAMVEGPRAGLELIDALKFDHYRVDATRAHLLEKLGEVGEAIALYRRAANRTDSTPERNHLLLKAATLAEK